MSLRQSYVHQLFLLMNISLRMLAIAGTAVGSVLESGNF